MHESDAEAACRGVLAVKLRAFSALRALVEPQPQPQHHKEVARLLHARAATVRQRGDGAAAAAAAAAAGARARQLVNYQRRTRALILESEAAVSALSLSEYIDVLPPKLVELRPFVRTSFVDDVPVGVPVAPVRRPSLLLKKMKAAKIEENAKKQKAERIRQAELAERQKRELKERMEMQHKLKKKMVRESFLKALLEHHEKFRNYHRESQRTLKALASQSFSAIITRERKKRSQEDKEQRMRMKALKENDMDAYTSLLSEHKNERLTNLLKQTEEYMSQLGALAEGEGSSNIYHNVVEEVTEQPNMMKFGTLKDYQLAGLQWLVSLYNNNSNGILADEMGLGKTIQTIALICYIMEKKGDHGPFMIVVPLSTMSNWVKEFERWAPSVMLVEYAGKPPERRELWKKFVSTHKFNVLLTTYDYVLNKHDRSKLESIEWHFIIVDEGHRMKNHKSKFTVALNTRYRSLHRLLLTGTPLQNNLSELWSLLNFLVPNIFNSSENFDVWFNKPFENAGVENAELIEEEKLLIIHRLHQVLRPFLLRRLKVEVADSLPDKVERVIKCELSVWQKVMYKQVQQKFVPTINRDSGTVSARGLNNTFMQLRKICNHPYLFYDDMEYNWEKHRTTTEIYRCSGKFEILDRMLPKIQRSKHKALIFTQMTRVLDIMEDYMEWKQFPYLRLDGQTKPEMRSKFLELFNAPNSPYFVFLLSTRAGGLGLNLQTADTVIIFDSDWNPQMDLQAQDRAHRIGQQAEVRVFRLVTCSPIEEQILNRAQFKLGLDHMIIQAGKFNKNSTHTERKAMLTAVMRSGVDMGEEVETPSAERINRMLCRSEEEFDLFQEIDAEMERNARQEWESSGNVGPCPPRLMRDIKELPEYLQDIKPMPKEKTPAEMHADYGRGRRKRDEVVSYADVFSEKQFCQLVEDGVDLAEAARIKRKQMAELGPDYVDENEEDGDFSGNNMEDNIPPKKRKKDKSFPDKKRKLKVKPVKLLKKGRRKSSKQGKKIVASALLDSLNIIMSDLLECRDELGRPCSASFEEMEHVIDLNTMRIKTKQNAYPSAEEFVADFNTMLTQVHAASKTTELQRQHASQLQRRFRQSYKNEFATSPKDPDSLVLHKVRLRVAADTEASAVSTNGSASSAAGAASDSETSEDDDVDVGVGEEEWSQDDEDDGIDGLRVEEDEPVVKSNGRRLNKRLRDDVD